MKEDYLFFARARAKFTEEKRLIPYTDAAGHRKSERTDQESTTATKLKQVHSELMTGIRDMWGLGSPSEVEQKEAGMQQELQAAQAELVPPVEVEEPPPAPSAAPSVSPVEIPDVVVEPKAIQKSPVEWEQTLHDAHHEDVLHLNDLLNKQLAGATQAIEKHGDVVSAVDRIEDDADAKVVEVAEDAAELDCERYPLLCKVRNESAPIIKKNSTAVVLPAGPDPVEVARKLVNHQGGVVATAQAALADLLKGADVTAEQEQQAHDELAKQLTVMAKAEAHLVALENNAEEMAKQKEMKDASLIVDVLALKLRRLEKQDPPVAKTIDKTRLKLEAAQEFYDDAHFNYVKFLKKLREEVHDAISEAETKLPELERNADLDASSKATLEETKTKLKRKQRELQRLDEALVAAGPAKNNSDDLSYVPTEEEIKQMDEVQAEKMKEAISNITHGVIHSTEATR